MLREIFASRIASVTGFSPDNTDSTIKHRLRGVASSSFECRSHFGVGRGRGLRRLCTL